LGSISDEIAGDLQIVGVYTIHDVDSILGIGHIPALADVNSVTELSIMRVNGQQFEQSNSCSAFPISLHQGIRSVTPPGEGAVPYPDASDFQFPTNPPSYEDYYS